jgi:hypothetical protein
MSPSIPEESTMRTTGLAILAAAMALAVTAPAQATSVPPFKGNDTGGIIAYSLYQQGVDVKALALDHCARYGKSVKLTGVDAQYGGYISFACVWVHPGHIDRPLRAAY